MNSKFLWITSFILLCFLVIVIGKSYFLPVESFKSVSGAKTIIPDLTSSDVKKPPIKKEDAKDPIINSNAAILIDGSSFKQLFQQNADLKVPIASTTKIMSSLVVLEDYLDKLENKVNLTNEMINVEGSDMQLRPSETISVNNLLKGMLIVSGNDAAFALASYLGGKEQFVGKMNEKAEVLGLKNTQFKDPAGLDDEGYSNANDLATLTSYALRNKIFSDIVKTPNTTIASENGSVIHELKSSNRMLRSEEQYYYPFTIGIKTGFTPAAGHCLVSAAEKDGHVLIAVILNTNENSLTASAKESRKLLDWGFNNWTWSN